MQNELCTVLCTKGLERDQAIILTGGKSIKLLVPDSTKSVRSPLASVIGNEVIAVFPRYLQDATQGKECHQG